jgi:hypothetical protein
MCGVSRRNEREQQEGTRMIQGAAVTEVNPWNGNGNDH